MKLFDYLIRLQGWSRSPRNLLFLFGLVLLLPAATLISLGVRLLDQDRALARQRQAELLERAADSAVRALDADLGALRKRLAGQPCAPENVPPAAICVVLHGDRFQAMPPQAVPYFPATPGFREPPAAAFGELEEQEFGQAPNLEKALAISRSLSSSSDSAIRAGALLRRARILRALKRPGEALAVYLDLSQIQSVSLNGEPVDLVARRARCAMLEEQSRTRELHGEAESLAADLRSGRWQLDRETYLYVAGILSRWLGAELKAGEQEQRAAEAVAWLYSKWITERPSEPSTGIQVLRTPTPLTIVWAIESSRATAFLAGARFLESEWMPHLQQAAAPAQVYLSGLGSPPLDALKFQRIAADTGLPWSIVVAVSSGSDPLQLQSRRRNLLAGMAAVLMMVAAGSYLLWRSVNRDLAIARLQSDFVSAVSHEFRTPLTALRQFNELLVEDDGPTAETRRRYYQAQNRATERLHRLVESLLDFGRMEARRRLYYFESLDARVLVRDVTEEFRLEPDASVFTVSYRLESVPCLVAADREALSRALWNLLDNAVKYSGHNREIDVAVERANSLVSMNRRHRKVITLTAGMILLLSVLSAQTQDRAEAALKAAMDRESVDGNLRAAIEQYKKLATDPNKSVAARALVRLGECYEKQGSADARKAYEQVLSRFGDQKEAAERARSRLAALGSSRSVGRQTTSVVWKDKTVTIESAVSPDGRYISYADWGTGNLGLHDLASGGDRRLTTAGSWTRGQAAFAEDSAFSRDGKQVAYAWYEQKTAGFELRVTSASGDGNPRSLFRSAEWKWLSPRDWSPDGRWIAVSLEPENSDARTGRPVRPGERAALGLVDVRNGSLRILKTTEWRGSFGPNTGYSRILFSPDGRHVAYDRPSGETRRHRDVFVLTLGEDRETPVAAGPFQEELVAWSSDGQHLLFTK